jgi:hypothetical protein
MRRLLLLTPIVALACGQTNPENTASCGISIMAGAALVLEQLRGGSKVITDVPMDLRGTVAARVPGYGTMPALVGESPDGPIVAYDGEGFPTRPGFGLALVEDSTDAFMGVLIYDVEPPTGYPLLGGVTNGSYMVPLYGLRVSWGAVSNPRCPLFARIDTTET